MSLLLETGGALLLESGGSIVLSERNYPVYRWNCRSFGDQSTPPRIRSTLAPADDLVKGDGVDTDTYPTFVAADTAAGEPSHYVFDGVDDYVGNWPTMPTEYTVCAVFDDGAGPFLWTCNNETIEYFLTTPGVCIGKLYRLAIFDVELDADELRYLEYWWVHRVPRGSARGIDHRKIIDGSCILALYFGSATPNTDESDSGADTVDADVSYDGDGAEITSSTGNIVPEGLTSDSGEISVFFEGSPTDGTIFEWVDLLLTVSVSGSVITFDLSGSLVDLPIGDTYCFTVVSGYVPRWYVDGEYVDSGSSAVTFGAFNADPVIGNAA